MVTSPSGDSGAPECIRYEPKTRKSLKKSQISRNLSKHAVVLLRCWEHCVSSLWAIWRSVIGSEVILERILVSGSASETIFYIGFWYTISASEAATLDSNRLGCQRLVHCMITWSTDKRMAPNTPFPHFRFLYDFTSSSWYRISPQNRYQTNSEWSIGGRIVNIMSPNDTTHKQRSKRLPKPHIPSQNLAVDALARNRWFRYNFACLMLFDTTKSQEPDTGLYNRGMNV